MRTGKPARKTVTLPVAFWYDAAHDTIHLAARNAFVTTLNNDAKSKRGHPQLFAKLAACLKAADRPHPNLAAPAAAKRQTAAEARKAQLPLRLHRARAARPAPVE